MSNILPSNDSTFVLSQSESDTMDNLDYEIGDALQPTFYPQVKIKKWDNEANLSIRLVEPTESTLSNVDGQVVFDNNLRSTAFYELNDGFEFEVTLKSKPASNVLNFTLQHKGIRATYQGELTQEEINDGCYRPPEVVGSYAIYHATKKNQQYKTGKIGHIYRPWAEDAKATRVWCDLVLDLENNTATITIPQNFLDKATYPVKVDPTFGNTNVGGTSWTSSSYSLAVRTADDASFGYTASSGDSVTTMHLYQGSTGHTAQMCLYTTTSGVADAKDGGNTGNITSTGAGWFTASHSVSLTASSEYVCAVGQWSGGVDMRYDSNANNVTSRESDSGALGDPFAEQSVRVYELSMYATYTTGGGGGNVYQINIGDAWKTIDAIQINIGDAWKAAPALKINIGDAWKTIF